MERLAVLGRVIKSTTRLEGIIAVILEARVPRDLMPQLEQLIELGLEGFPLGQPPLRHHLPGLLSQRAIGFLQITPHLNQGPLFPAKIHRQGAAEFLVLLSQARLLRFQGDILCSRYNLTCTAV